jgi:hypothetical protein
VRAAGKVGEDVIGEHFGDGVGAVAAVTPGELAACAAFAVTQESAATVRLLDQDEVRVIGCDEAVIAPVGGVWFVQQFLDPAR